MDLLTSAYLYPIALAILSVGVAAAERLWPWRPEQRAARTWLWSDALHLIFNGHFLGAILAGLAANYLLPTVDAWLAQRGAIDAIYRNAASEWPLWVQLPVALVVVDFIQWSVHNLLHRVPFFWEMHKAHHSVKDGEMDWIVSFRFQWTEVVVYKTVLYLPLVWFGFGHEALMFHAIFGTFIGHLNHANLDLGHTWLRYVFNSPRMHLWHHDYDRDGTNTVNFGIIFSVWDWLFKTAYMPEHTPRQLGFHGVETFPNDFFGQAAWPLTRWLPAGGTARLGASALGVALVAAGYLAAQPPSLAARTPLLGEPMAASQPATAPPAPASAYAADPAAATAALAGFGAAARAAGYAHPEHLVSAAELAAALGSPRLVLLDVRPADRYRAGHIPGARAIDRPDFSTTDGIKGLDLPPEALQAALRARGVRQDSVVVLYGDGGPEPHRLWWTLQHTAGYATRILDGNLEAWRRAGHALAAGDGPALTPGDLTLRPPPEAERPCCWAQLQAFREGAVLLDARSLAEHQGASTSKGSARPGRIPGSRSLEWLSLLRSQADQRLRPPAELRARFAAVGVTPGETRVLTYCQSGTRSALLHFALHQLGADARTVMNYDGSFAEYSRLDLPVDLN